LIHFYKRNIGNLASSISSNKQTQVVISR